MTHPSAHLVHHHLGGGQHIVEGLGAVQPRVSQNSLDGQPLLWLHLQQPEGAEEEKREDESLDRRKANVGGYAGYTDKTSSNQIRAGKDSLAYDVLGHLRDLAPLVFREVEATRHNLFPHVLRDSATVVLGVEWRIAAQHHVDYHPERPQITALEID